MNQQRSLPKPPRIAEWLTGLFLPADAEEAVLRDLQEEFSALTVSSGAAQARAWYRRQAVTTILRAGPNAFRAAPLRMLITVLGGIWLLGFTTTLSTRAMQRFLDALRVYEVDPSAYLFWLKFPLEIGRLVICSVLGCLVALVAKRYELPAAASLALAQLAMFCAGTITLIAYGRHWPNWFLAMAPWNILCAIATVAGAIIVLKCKRSKTGQVLRG